MACKQLQVHKHPMREQVWGRGGGGGRALNDGKRAALATGGIQLETLASTEAQLQRARYVSFSNFSSTTCQSLTHLFTPLHSLLCFIFCSAMWLFCLFLKFNLGHYSSCMITTGFHFHLLPENLTEFTNKPSFECVYMYIYGAGQQRYNKRAQAAKTVKKAWRPSRSSYFGTVSMRFSSER